MRDGKLGGCSLILFEFLHVSDVLVIVLSLAFLSKGSSMLEHNVQVGRELKRCLIKRDKIRSYRKLASSIKPLKLRLRLPHSRACQKMLLLRSWTSSIPLTRLLSALLFITSCPSIATAADRLRPILPKQADSLPQIQPDQSRAVQDLPSIGPLMDEVDSACVNLRKALSLNFQYKSTQCFNYSGCSVGTSGNKGS
ncbi:hypothetical protein F5880DRAFT_1249763 [Lentinula raphanica]|nr:hypothetical protein F5880DRAFT_1249763 [Lentinula raphanica]